MIQFGHYFLEINEMASFKKLKDICLNFDKELQRVSADLFSAKVTEDYENVVAKKLRDLSFFTSKLRLLRAEPLSLTQQQSEARDAADVLQAYSDEACWRVVEQQTVKATLQSRAVRKLLCTADGALDTELVERKEKIKSQLNAYKEQEATLQQLYLILSEKEDELARVRARWHDELGALRDLKSADGEEEVDTSGPCYGKLEMLVKKIEVMRWLTCQLVTPRTGYDWLADPSRRLAALRRARQPVTVGQFIDS